MDEILKEVCVIDCFNTIKKVSDSSPFDYFLHQWLMMLCLCMQCTVMLKPMIM